MGRNNNAKRAKAGRKQQQKGLGRALVRDRDRRRQVPDHDYINYHEPNPEEPKKEAATKLRSVTQNNDLDELAMQAQLADTEFTAEKQNIVILESSAYKVQLEPSEQQLRAQLKYFNELKIPRRPPWTRDTTPQELDKNERGAFLEWRRNLAEIETAEGLILTPFEKNLEVWRQLWRVVERSDVVVQIVDARNPMIRCTDLEQYVKEVDPAKKNILLVNKADLLTVKQRGLWAEYFRLHGVEHFLFWSANYENIELEKKRALMERKMQERKRAKRKGFASTLGSDDREDEDEDDDNDDVDDEQKSKEEDKREREATEPTENGNREEEEEEEKEEKKEEAKAEEEDDESTHIHGTDEFLQYLLKVCPLPSQPKREGESPKIIVGMVGYPNVGKSSTINVLCGKKKVAVAITPGKTKHLQTIRLTDHITLCDCPGLVFPSFLTTKAEMICSGLLPIDHMRDHRGPVTLVCNRLPRSVLEWMYGIKLPAPQSPDDPDRPPTAEELLQTYGRMRGFMTVHGAPNESIAARIVLKDYLKGKLLYVHPPPGMEDRFKQWWEDDEANLEHLGVTAQQVREEEAVGAVERKQQAERQLKSGHDLSFERQETVVARTKARAAAGGQFTRVQRHHAPAKLTKRAQAKAKMAARNKPKYPAFVSRDAPQ